MAAALGVDLNENVRISTIVIIYRKCVPNYDCVMPFVYMYVAGVRSGLFQQPRIHSKTH